MDIFPPMDLGPLSITAMFYFSGKANTSIHGLREDDTVKLESVNVRERLEQPEIWRHWHVLAHTCQTYVAEYSMTFKDTVMQSWALFASILK